jgi:hypothetical protein
MAKRILGPTGSRRRGHLLLILALAAVGALVLALGSSANPGAIGTAAKFEDDDANLAVNSTFDWNGFASVTWTGTAPYRTSSKTTANPPYSAQNAGWEFNGFEDDQASNTDTGFAGGVKQDADCGSLKPGKAPNKDDLKRIYLTHKTISGHVYLMLGFVRIPLNSTQSSTHIGFEFNEKKLGTCSGSSPLVKRTPQAWGGNPAHSGGDPTNPGDLLIVYDYEGSTSSPTLTLRHWIDSNTTLSAPYNTCEISSDSPPCWSVAQSLTASGFAEAQVNFGANGVPGAGITDSLAPNSPPETLGLKEFGEAGVDLTAAGVFTSGTCTGFGQAEAVSRSSGNSGSAAMEDIDGPGSINISNCASVNVTKVGSDGGSQAGVVFTLTGPAPSSATQTCTVDANGQCGSSPSFSNLQPGSYTLSESNTPAGYDVDPNLPETFTVNAGDSITKSYTDNAQPGAISITKADDHGDPIANVTFTATGPSSGQCTTDSSGACTISSLSPGSYSVDETGLPAGYAKDSSLPATVNVTKGQTATLNVTDPRLFRAIVLVCRQFDSTLYSSAIKIDTVSSGNSETSAQLGTLLQTWATATGLGALSAADKTAFEAAVCGITNGSKDSLRAANDASNPHSASIDIPH